MNEDKKILLFVKLYNEINNNKITKHDLSKPYLRGIFDKTIEFMGKFDTQVVEKGIILPTTSKSDSFLKLNIDSLDNKVLELIKSYPGMSRKSYSRIGEIKTETLTGCVNRLINSNLVEARGTILDSDTNRTVDRLFAK